MPLPVEWRVEAEPEAAPGVEPLSLRHPEPGLNLVLDASPPQPVVWYGLTLAYEGPGVVDARLALHFDDGSRLPLHLAKTGRNRFFGMFRPVRPVSRVVVAVSGSAALADPSTLELRRLRRGEQRRALLRRASAVLRGDPRSFPWRVARFLIHLSRQGRTAIPLTTEVRGSEAAYALWRERFDERPELEAGFHASRVAGLVARPVFTVLAAPDLQADALAALRASLEAQCYPEWELLVPRGAPTDDPRVKPYDPTAPDEAFAAARGAFALLPRPDTRLRPHALAVLARAVVRFPNLKLVYADEDRLASTSGDDGTRADPVFKPAWSPQRLLTANYLGDLCAIALPLLADTVFGPGFGFGAWRHDIMLHLGERVARAEVLHVAQVLSHGVGSSAQPATEERKAAIRRALARRGADARVMSDPRSPHPRLGYAPPAPPLVTLIVPTRDRADLLRVAVASIRGKTAFKSYEVLVVDNGSVEDETFKLFDEWVGDAAIRVVRDDAPFNYARLNNRAAAAARGALLGLVNNDIEVRDPHWLDEMTGLAMQPGIGCVGAKLWYPDGRLQHGGVVTGIAGAAGHRNKRAGRSERGARDDLVTVNEVSAVTAACLVVRKSIYDEVGGLDEATFAVGYNDVDFCLKVAAAGYSNLWTPFAELVHHESVSRGRDLGPRTAERFNREVLALRLRWGDRLLDDPYYSPNLTADAEDGTIRVQ